jgi:hypothetical protein
VIVDLAELAPEADRSVYEVHTMLVIGKRDMEADAASVRVHGKGISAPRRATK